ncbi:helix-turn-helix transcriptional regulator [Actinocorallia longicatena]|uniref:YafY family protein n=1 Tax=Actinocorallia longicatena TaxID=111803 RepID=A0ABP6QKL3_9ACTN
MRDPSGRLLRLLSLLQTPRDWSGTELGDRLGVTPRTIRRDVDRLRELGYPVHATQGATGGYRLTAGSAMPPLLLDDDEAVAIAIGLRSAAASAVTGIEETSLRALAKLEQVLPHRLRHRVRTLAQAAVGLPPVSGPAVDPELLAALAAACATHEKIRFTYTTPGSPGTRRLVEPHRVVGVGRRWYLVSYDEGRDAWRTFRADRVSELRPTGVRVAERTLPGGVDAATWVGHWLSGREGIVRARLLLHLPLERAAELVPGWLGVLEPVDERSCLLVTHPDSPENLAHRIPVLPVGYTLLGPARVRAHLRVIAERALAGTDEVSGG